MPSGLIDHKTDRKRANEEVIDMIEAWSGGQALPLLLGIVLAFVWNKK